MKSALNGARTAIKSNSGRSQIRIPRISQIPTKTCRILPFLGLIFAKLSAVGALAGDDSSITRAVSQPHEAKRHLSESKRHKQIMEVPAICKGMLLKIY